MKVAVFDTYVKKKKGGVMHFDVIVPVGTEIQEVYRFGHEYLREKDQEGQELASRNANSAILSSCSPRWKRISGIKAILF